MTHEDIVGFGQAMAVFAACGALVAQLPVLACLPKELRRGGYTQGDRAWFGLMRLHLASTAGNVTFALKVHTTVGGIVGAWVWIGMFLYGVVS